MCCFTTHLLFSLLVKEFLKSVKNLAKLRKKWSIASLRRIVFFLKDAELAT